MNFIYDITLNFKKEYLSFYEWRDEDNPIFILKIPLIKVSENTFLDIKNNNVIFYNDLINLIKNKTEIYSPSSVKINKYSFLLAYEEEVLALMLDENKKVIKKSSLSIDEENDVLNMLPLIKNTFIDYKVLNKKRINLSFKTRSEKERIKKLEKLLNKIMIQKKYDFLKYIYYEIYLEKSDDINKIYIKLLNIIKNYDDRINKFDEIVNLVYK